MSVQKWFRSDFLTSTARCVGNIRFLTLTLLVGYSVSRIVTLIGYSFWPDETWFHSMGVGFARANDLLRILKLPNHLGYGGMYWIIQGLSVKLIDDYNESLILLRVLILVLYLTIPIIIIYTGKKIRSSMTWEALLVWLLMPAAWWGGKVTGPEVFSLFFCFLGTALLLKSYNDRFENRLQIFFGSFAYGLAIGFKVNAITIPVFMFVAVGLGYGRKNWNNLKPFTTLTLLGGISLICGFITANPFVLKYPTEYWVNLKKHKYPSNWSYDHFQYFMSNRYWEWDTVLNGGFSEWAFPLWFIPCLALFLLVARVPWTLLTGLGISFLTTILMLLENSRFLGWYWFPFISLIPFVILTSKENKQAKISALVAVSLLAFFNVPKILYRTQLKLKHNEIISHAEEISRCLDKNIRQNSSKFDKIYIVSDVGVSVKDGIPNVVSLFKSHVTFLKTLVPSENYLIVLGDRIRKIPTWRAIGEYLEDQSIPGRADMKVEAFNYNCPYLSFYHVSKGASAGI